METLGLLMACVLVALAVLFAISAFYTKVRRASVSFGISAFALLAGALILGATTVKLSSPTPNVDEIGRDFYQVMWEEKTPKGMTVVVVKDNSGEFYFSEFDEPLAVEKILAIEKGRFKPLLLSEKPDESKKVVPVPKK